MRTSTLTIQLADSVSAMEARKHRLTTQLAKLNTQVLTSEFPRVGSALHMISPKPKRRRISDIQNALGASRVGLGSPKQLALENRRAVSSKLRMPQVPEDDLPAIHSHFDSSSNQVCPFSSQCTYTESSTDAKSFDHDRIVAALRRALTSRDHDLKAKSSELDTAIAQLTRLQEQLISLHQSKELSSAEHESAMLDFHTKLESTRTELVATVNEKAEKIDTLETTVLDLRTSREELLLESEIKTDELRAQLDAAVQETTTIKDLHSIEMDQVLTDVDRLRVAADKLPDLQSKLEEAEGGRLTAIKALDTHQQASLARESEMERSRLQLEKTNEELRKLQSELSIRQGIEGDQTKLEVMLVSERAGRKMAEEDNRGLVAQLAELRELRLKAQAWEKEKVDLNRQVDSANTTITAQDTELLTVRETIKTMTKDRDSMEQQVKVTEIQLKETKDQLHDQSSEVFQLQMQLSTNTAESSNRINSLESQLLAEKDRARHLDEVKSVLAEKQRQLDESATEVGRLRTQIDSSSTSSAEQTERLASLEEQLRTQSTERRAGEEDRTKLEAVVADLRAATERHEAEASNLSLELKTLRKKLESADHATETESFARRDLAARLERKTEELKACQTALEVARASETEHSGSNQKLTADLMAAVKDLEVARSAAETLSKANEALETRLGASQEEIKARQAMLAEVEKTAESLRSTLAARETNLTTLSANLDEERKARSMAEEGLKLASNGQDEMTRALRQQLEDSRQTLTDTDKSLSSTKASLERAHADNKALESELAEAKSAIATSGRSSSKVISDLEAQLECTTRDLKTCEADLVAGKKEQANLLARLNLASDDDDRKSHAANNQIRQLEKRLQDTLTQISDLEARLSSAQTDRTQAEEKSARVSKDHEKIIEQSNADLAILRTKYDEQSRTLSTTRSELDKQVAALKQAELASKERQELVSKVDRLSSDFKTQKTKLDNTVVELSQAKIELRTANATIQRLTGELKSAKAALPTPRNASAPTSGINLPTDELRMQALKTASTGDGNLLKDRLRTKEHEEIEKLEKVIETQVEIINDQAEKIRFWSKVSPLSKGSDAVSGVRLNGQELEQQRDIVRMLTQDGTLNLTPTKRSPYGHSHGLLGHAKSKSLSVADLENQSPHPSPVVGASGAGPGSTHAKVYLPSSFTAKNLALPTTPTPLPMHPSQFSNTTMRKGRRVTIDHDLDLLTGESLHSSRPRSHCHTVLLSHYSDFHLHRSLTDASLDPSSILWHSEIAHDD